MDGGEVGFPIDAAHACAATSGGGFQQDWIADLGGGLFGGSEIGQGLLGSGNDGSSGGEGQAAGGGFGPHLADDGGGRADEDDAGGGASLGEFRVFAQEAIAGMDGVDAVLPGGVEYPGDIEIAFGGRGGSKVGGFVGKGDGQGGSVGIGKYRDASNSKLPETPDQSYPYLSAV